MNGYGVYNTSDEFLDEFIAPADQAEVRTAAAEMADAHREESRRSEIAKARAKAVRKESRRSQIAKARAKAVRKSRARQARTITVRAPRTSPARKITIREGGSTQTIVTTTTRSVLKATGSIPHLVGPVIRVIQEMLRSRF
ncbi:hypothetical protein [Streptomyces sp. NPDC050528]|uniref:hypothetical protein n=1 Tax=Streptomyces sp. NPDC050528 TaxID=3365623 RepID=UPI0037A369AE